MAMNAPKGKGKQGGGKGKGSGKPRGGPGGGYTSKRQVGGKGIFVTTIRGKESRCVGEMYDLLDEVADRLYPPERIDKMVAARQADIDARKALGPPAPAADADAADPSPSPTSAPPAPAAPTAPAPNSDDDYDDDDDDIEASIQRELAALKSGRGSGKMAPGRTAAGGAPGADGQDKGKSKERPRFQSIATDTECLCFIATAWPYDPVELTEALVAEVQETGQSRTRFVQRLSPTTITCHSLSLEQVEQQSAGLIEKSFASWAAANNKTTVTYAIEPVLRSHTQPLSRHLLLQLLGSLTSRLSSAPTISSPVPDRPILSVRADLKNPDLVLLPTVLKNVYGLSVVEGHLWKNKKFNLEQIALDVGRKRLERSEADKAAAGAGASASDVAASDTAGASAAEEGGEAAAVPVEPGSRDEAAAV
ncbi:uncharacterized protein RHOBADRAFT_54485 [Rhodotorula graminis WP1]|uniref:THUMP domain-containing protein n=1 Tax=Rhodotorula graminis (strain WP1) TaxID=578459 RepID=A0A0P9GKL7_RHOGW|nr:uncharacterized protein RHOBADRAFT_54485 [Rhodotorula graminis WP1]KPV73897.1 hypothetical protein RHOBADRAFT_54485 [Rhodotorula graminis WP1]